MYTFGALVGLVVGIVIGYITAHYYYKDKNLINYVLTDMSEEEVSKLLNSIVVDKPIKKARTKTTCKPKKKKKV